MNVIVGWGRMVRNITHLMKTLTALFTNAKNKSLGQAQFKYSESYHHHNTTIFYNKGIYGFGIEGKTY